MALERRGFVGSVLGIVALTGTTACSSAPDGEEPIGNAMEAVRNGTIVTPWSGALWPEWTKAIVQLPGCTGTVVKPSWVMTAKHCLTPVGSTVVSKRPSGDVPRVVDVMVPDLDPCIPTSWPDFEMERVFRGKKITIKVQNPERKTRGVKQLIVGGKAMQGNLLPLQALKDGLVVEAKLEG